MDRNDLIQKLREHDIHTKAHFYTEAFSRNIGLFTPAEQAALAEARVAIPGMGGVGGGHLMTMIRMGVGKYHLADFDKFEAANINRQYGARVSDFGRSKLEVMKEEALSVNPYADIRTFPRGISESNIDDFLYGVDVVLDSLDYFEFDIRRMLFNRAREKGVYVVTAGPMGFSSAILIFSPHDGMGFDEYFNIVPGMTPQDHYLAFAIGLAPRATHFKYMDTSRVDLNKKAGPSSIIGCQLCSGMAAAEVMRIILKKDGVKPAPYYSQFDPFRQKFRKGRLFMGNMNPIQKLKFRVAKKLLLNQKRPVVKKTIEPPEWKAGDSAIPENVVRYLVEMGTWATSADNCQPWKFEWTGNRLLLQKDPERTGFFYDVNQESTFLTFGAVIENIRIAASHYGLVAEVEYLPEGAEASAVAIMTFRFEKREEDLLFPYLLSRCVNRNPYNKRSVPGNIMDLLTYKKKNDSGIRIHLISDDNQKKIFRKIIYKADRILFEDKRLHGGLFKWVRREIEPDGMGWDTLGLNFFQKKIFPLLSEWPTMNLLNKIGASRISGANSVKLLKSSSFYCLITIDERAPIKYIKGGEAMQRFWIKSNSFGLSLQPMAGFLFLLNHYYDDQGKRFSKNHRRMIEDIHRYYFSIPVVSQNVPLFFFRAGFAKPQLFHNRRRLVADVLFSRV